MKLNYDMSNVGSIVSHLEKHYVLGKYNEDVSSIYYIADNALKYPTQVLTNELKVIHLIENIGVSRFSYLHKRLERVQESLYVNGYLYTIDDDSFNKDKNNAIVDLDRAIKKAIKTSQMSYKTIMKKIERNECV